MASVISEDIKQTVAFIFHQRQELEPIGTGFFMGIAQENTHFIYFVTAKHVIMDETQVFLRLNLRNYDPSSNQLGTLYQPVQVKDDQGNLLWFVHSDPSVDVAVLPFAPNPELIQFKCIGPEVLATRDIIAKEKVAEGDEIFFTGLLPQFYRTKRNYPVVRYGRIALLTDEVIEVQGEGPQELYFAECQTFPGNSGSPVFLRFGPTREPGVIRVGGERLFLLGLMKGYFSQRQLLEIQETQRLFLQFNENIGIAAIVPGEKIKDILYSVNLTRIREETTSRLKQKQSSVQL